ncbi:hypothetical protein BSR29_00220 [Boudabousia liubingyangii]|uniref:Peptidase S54 rhomboid domain-containing protein n=1 Tax=Boudabousia liubingyangii TaxID=1921764 RepID=A0A1Q5PPB1_9ACTO|nr:rhomboid family intramembrane serine protease [Boudabousia liubingyangii]OKL48533.1 hypothetical protein BSR28_02260 [Boudabousia liubingyangii]OKL49431.1 hypothetical protein BSR29_00220 [Boudabousia liubingyangii]
MTTVIMGICLFFAVIYAIAPNTLEPFWLAPGVAYLEPWRLLTSAFMHFGLAHILLNMYCLYLVGTVLEKMLGSTHFLALYLFCSLGASVFVEFAQLHHWSQPSYTAGASGAIMGLFGALLVIYRRLDTQVLPILVLLIINVVSGIIYPGISWEGHLGGALAGILYTAVVLWPRWKQTNVRRTYQIAATTVLTALLIFGHWYMYQSFII